MGLAIAALCGLVWIFLGGGSTIVKGSEQVSVATPRVQGAMCTLTSPAVGTRASNSRNHHPPQEPAQCLPQLRYSDGVGMLTSETEFMTVGNVLFGGVMGLRVDAAAAAMK
jgi:hypothetical protein